MEAVLLPFFLYNGLPTSQIIPGKAPVDPTYLHIRSWNRFVDQWRSPEQRDFSRSRSKCRAAWYGWTLDAAVITVLRLFRHASRSPKVCLGMNMADGTRTSEHVSL